LVVDLLHVDHYSTVLFDFLKKFVSLLLEISVLAMELLQVVLVVPSLQLECRPLNLHRIGFSFTLLDLMRK
jgi:hypothetical protein